MTPFETKTLELATRRHKMCDGQPRLETLADVAVVEELQALNKTIYQLECIRLNRHVWRNRVAFYWNFIFGRTGL